jgi:hypothetical protein
VFVGHDKLLVERMEGHSQRVTSNVHGGHRFVPSRNLYSGELVMVQIIRQMRDIPAKGIWV